MDFFQYVKREKGNNKPVCFFTVNDLVNEDKLAQKLKSLSLCGYGGIYFHARSGFIGSYLSDEWFSIVGKAIAYCEKYRLEFWVYDEFGWPSGIAGGSVLKNNLSLGQKRIAKNHNPRVRTGRVIAYYDNDDNIATENNAVYAIEEIVDGGYADVLNKKTAEAFINATHEEYKRRFGDRIKGFFTDEPQFGLRFPAWNDIIERKLIADFGDKAYSFLPALFAERTGKSLEDKRFRNYYFGLCSSLFIENFIRPLSEWCVKNGYMLTGHILEEKKLSYEVRSCADVFDVYKEMQCPGMDWLGSKTGNAIAPRQVASVYQRYKKARCVSETGATMGYGRSLTDIADLFEWEVALGITNICGIIPYSVRGRRKRDYPSGIITEQPYFDKLSAFNDRLSRLCAVAALEEVADVLLIQPLESARENYVYGEPTAQTAHIDELYENAVKTLTKKACLFHIASLKEVESGDISENGIKIGRINYNTVIALDEHCRDAANKKNLQKNGVNVITNAADAPSRIKRVKTDGELFLTVHKYGEDFVLTAKNTGNEPVSNEILFDGELPVCEMDLNDGMPYGFEIGEISAKQTAVYVFGKARGTLNREKEKVKAIDEENFKYFPLQKNLFILDKAYFSLDGGVCGALPVIKLFEKLIAEEYKGRLTMSFVFENRGYNGKISVLVEDSRRFEVFLNGEKLKFSDDESQEKNLLDGINTVTLKADYFQKEHICKIWKGEEGVESDFNMIGDMFELENICLKGDFGVFFDESEKCGNVYSCDKPYITRQKSGGSSSELVLNGFPFYCGAFALEKEVNFSGGENSVAPIIKNGCAVIGDKTIYFNKEVKITDKDGIKNLRIILYNTLRNCFGPNHNIYGEGMDVGFTTFSSAPGWCDPQGKDMWTDRYMLIPFGVSFSEQKRKNKKSVVISCKSDAIRI